MRWAHVGVAFLVLCGIPTVFSELDHTTSPPGGQGVNSHHKRQGNAPRSRQEAPEGTSLRSLIGLADAFIPEPHNWEVLYDEESGHPYYFNKVRVPLCGCAGCAFFDCDVVSHSVLCPHGLLF